MKAVKANKVYTIDKTQKALFIAQGYDITDDENNIIEYGSGKAISLNEYKELEKENEDLKEKISKLEKENKKLKDEAKKLKE